LRRPKLNEAFSDALTGLPNRALFMNRLAGALAAGQLSVDRVAVMLIDLDRFKVVNDSLGHEAGDGLLVTVAARLTALVRPGDLVARLGGDEFTVLLRDVRDIDDVLPTAEAMVRELTTPIRIGGRDVVVGASIGIALGGDQTADDLLRRADLAMYRAKEQGKSRYAVFDTGLDVRARERLDLEGELRRALTRGELHVVYQPEIALATGRLTGAEALVRWQHPARGDVSPDVFIPLAEQTGLIRPLGRWVLETACRQARAWQDGDDSGCTPPAVSVNVSAQQVQDPGFVDEMAAILARTGLAPAALTLEITERVLLADAEQGADTIRQLRALGVRIALDDFGTGYSALGYLRRYPIDVLKIDKSFVDGIATDPTSAALVQAILTLAATLGLTTVAEGIEHPEQAARLRALGCARGQGFHLGFPEAGGLMGAPGTVPTTSPSVAA
jgi:diguanylate cyclase (GGDEF)-like protein